MLGATWGDDMQRWMLGSAVVCSLLLVPLTRAGELKQRYHDATPPGAWSQYHLTAKDGTVATYSYERKADDHGQVVLELEVKTTAGAGAGSSSTMTYTMPKGFDLGRDGLSYGRFTEKMTMQYGDMVMPVDANTLEVIRNAEKDYRGKLTAAGTEKIGDYACDRYTYDLSTATTRETGTLWLNPTVPFGIVRHAGLVRTEGQPASEFDMVLADRGQIVMTAEEPEAAPAPQAKAEPAVVTLADGFQAGRIGLDVKTLSGGRQLSLEFRNEYEAELTIKLAAGPVDLKVDFPVDTLKIHVRQTRDLVLPRGTSSEPIVVDQRGPRGIAEGKCYLSVYEGTPVFQGSVTMGNVPK